MKKIVHDKGAYTETFTEIGELSHTIAYLKFKDGCLWLVHPTKKGNHFERLEDVFSDYINTPVQITCKQFELKVKLNTDNQNKENKR